MASDKHDNFEDFDMCPDCAGEGTYLGFNFIHKCSRCDGAGWVTKGQGWDKRDAIWEKIMKRITQKGPLG